MTKSIPFLAFLLVNILTSTVLLGQTANNYLNFDGSNDNISIDDDSLFNFSGDFTLEFMFRQDFANTRGDLFGKKQLINSNLSENNLAVFITSTNQLRFYIKGSLSSNPTILNSTTSVPANQWIHVACVREGSIVRLYYNGTLQRTGSFTGSVTSNGRLSIGSNYQSSTNYNSPPTHPFNGDIDEARIWNLARTQQEILADLNNELVGNESGLIAYYNFNQGLACQKNQSVDTLIDKTSNKKTGTLNNFALTSNICASNWNGNITTGINDEVVDINNFSIYPNPTNEYFIIESKFNYERLDVFNLNGQLVKSESFRNQKIMVNDLKPGVYFVKILISQKVITERLIIN